MTPIKGPRAFQVKTCAQVSSKITRQLFGAFLEAREGQMPPSLDMALVAVEPLLPCLNRE